MHTNNSPRRRPRHGVGEHLRSLGGACLLLGCSVGWAQGTSNPDPLVDKLLQYGNETSVYKAMGKKLDAQLQVMTKQIEIDKLAPTTKREPGSVLLAVEGLNGKLIAVIEFIPGATIEAKTGDVLPDGQRVEAINFDSVVLRGVRNKRRVVLSVPQPESGSTVGGFEKMPIGAQATHD